jgi:hypothetical protein
MDVAISDRGDASHRAARSDRPRPRGDRFHRGADRGSGSRPALSMLIEPRLQEDRSGHAVDEFAPLPRGNATLSQPPRRFDRGEPLVDELDVPPCGIGQRLSELPRPGSFPAFLTAAIEGEADEKTLDPLVGSEPNELGDDLARLSSGEGGARMRHHAELVGHGQSHAHFPEINGRHTHLAASTL